MKKWLSQIWVYPIKSLPGFRVAQARVLGKGLEGDRRFMLIDSEGRFVTLREHPELCFFSVQQQADGIVVAHRHFPGTVRLTAPEAGDPIKARIWNDDVTVVEPNKEISQWFSDALQTNYRLVYFPEVNPRQVDPQYSDGSHHVSLSDGYPYLVVSTASVADIASKSGQDIEIQRFRPNFVVKGCTPYEEDSWRKFGLGTARFEGVKPCARCVVPTVNPITAERGVEPLRALNTFRKQNGKVYFGQNVLALSSGLVCERDEIILE